MVVVTVKALAARLAAAMEVGAPISPASLEE